MTLGQLGKTKENIDDITLRVWGRGGGDGEEGGYNKQTHKTDFFKDLFLLFSV